MNSTEHKISTLIVEVFCIVIIGYISFFLSELISVRNGKELTEQIPWLCLVGFLLLSTALLNDCFSINSIKKWEKFLLRWFLAWLITCFFYLLIFLLFSRESQAFKPGFVVPRLVPGVFLFLVLLGVPICRAAYNRIFHLAIRPTPALLVGNPSSCRYFLSEINQAGFKNWDFLGQLDPHTGKIFGLEGLKDANLQLSELSCFAVRNEVAEIILTDPSGLSSEALTSLMNCFELGVEILSLEQAFEKTMNKIPVEYLGDGWLPTTFWSHVQVPVFYRLFKKTLDICLAGVLLVGAFPLMCVTALLIKITSPGPVLYKQHRVGLYGRRFVIRKFRTMVDQPAENEQKWAEMNDSRITLVGNFLRKMRIDELPQLLNVIRGEMSLVGPRPEQPAIAAKLEQEIPYFRARGKVLPGITGWAQVKYRYGNSVEDSRIKLEYDLYYIKNRSILLDLIILAKTVRIVLGFKGQ